MFEHVKFRKGAVVTSELPRQQQTIAAVAQAADRLGEGWPRAVIPFVSTRISPLYVTLAAQATTTVAAPASDSWVTLATLHSVSPRVALRIAACVLRVLLKLHGAGFIHGFIEASAVGLRLAAFDAAIAADGASTDEEVFRTALPFTEEDDESATVVVGRFPLLPTLMPWGARGAARAVLGEAGAFQSLAPEIVRHAEAGGTRSPRPSAGTASSPASAALQEVSIVPVGRAADVWGIAALLANLISSTPLKTSDLVDAGVATPWMGHIDPALTSLLAQCLHRDPAQRPTLAEVATHPVFRFKAYEEVSTASRPKGQLTVDAVVAMLRRHKRSVLLSPQPSPTRQESGGRNDEDHEGTTGDDESDIEEEEGGEEEEEEVEDEEEEESSGEEDG